VTIYIASKTKHAPRWRDLRGNHGFQIISTWIDEAGPGESPNRPDLACRCISEAIMADRFILYCEPGEVLKGALVEMGAALAAGKPVFTVGECDNWPAGSAFVDHPLVERFDDVVTAMYANPIIALPPSLSATNWKCPKCLRWNSGLWRVCRSSYDTGIPCDGRRFFATVGAAGGEGK
jgi:hypothetical protein